MRYRRNLHFAEKFI